MNRQFRFLPQPNLVAMAHESEHVDAVISTPDNEPTAENYRKKLQSPILRHL
jgi:hypothetical protein